MGAFTPDIKKPKSDSAEGTPDGGDDGAGSWPASNGDNNGADSVDAKDTLFLKELRGKGQVRGAERQDAECGPRRALVLSGCTTLAL